MAAHPIRRNSTPRELKAPMAVVVRRFDPSGETLSRWEVLARDRRGAPAFLSLTAAKKAALRPPADAGLRVGDLIAVVPAEAAAFPEEYAQALFVVTPDGVMEAPAMPDIFVDGSWLKFGHSWLKAWEQNAYAMMLSADVGRKRLTMAACDCAETLLNFLPDGEKSPREALQTAREWCRGKASINKVTKYDKVVSSVLEHYVFYANFYGQDPSTTALADSARDAASSTKAILQAIAVASNYDPNRRAAHTVWFVANSMMNSSGVDVSVTYRQLASVVARWVPLSVAILSSLGYPDAIPFDPAQVATRKNGRRRAPRK